MRAACVIMAWLPAFRALYDAGHIEAVAVKQIPTFEAAIQFARAEGIVPAPESAHAIRAAIDEALDAKAKGEKRVILFNLSGHGNFDMGAYEAYLSGKLEDYEYPAEAVQEAMKHLPARAISLIKSPPAYPKCNLYFAVAFGVSC